LKKIVEEKIENDTKNISSKDKNALPGVIGDGRPDERERRLFYKK
jgi:hypothetical protein